MSPSTFVQNLPPALQAADLDRLWEELASDQPVTGRRAVGMLAAFPAVTGPYLRDKLKEAMGRGGDRVATLIAQLDDDRFGVRERATEELMRLREIAATALKEALRETTSAEVRHRIRLILKAPKTASRFSAIELRRFSRVIQLLESNARDNDSRALLESMSKNFPAAEIVREAQRALERVSRLPEHG